VNITTFYKNLKSFQPRNQPVESIMTVCAKISRIRSSYAVNNGKLFLSDNEMRSIETLKF